jgi:hypothetical protein
MHNGILQFVDGTAATPGINNSSLNSILPLAGVRTNSIQYV